MKTTIISVLLTLVTAWSLNTLDTASAQQDSVDGDQIAGMRNGAIDQAYEAPMMSQPQNDDIRRQRHYPMQPPVIPHKIENYQVDLNVNKCMTCHGRRETEDSGAPMVSVTHYMDRDGNFLAEISPRRYFCNQCHVDQMDVKPLVNNQFQDVDAIIKSLNGQEPEND